MVCKKPNTKRKYTKRHPNTKRKYTKRRHNTKRKSKKYGGKCITLTEKKNETKT